MRSYLDHNATSPLRPSVRAAMERALDFPGNASSVHAEGRAARKLVDDSREAVAQALGCLPHMLVFTSGGTEANNMAIRGVAADRILVAASEHPSVLAAARATGKPVLTIPVSGDGIIDFDVLRQLLDGPRALVSVMLANNETGVIQPVAEVADLVHRAGGLLHFGLLRADLVSVAAHKVGGPVGVGALVIHDGLPIVPLLVGGGQELRRRAGTENLAAIAGFAAVAAEKLIVMSALRDELESELEGAVVFSRFADRLSNTSCFALPGMNAETLLMAFDLEGLAVSSGSACSSGKVAQSHVLAAMGVAPELAKAAIRVSLGWNTTQENISHFTAVWRRLLARHRTQAA
jgi:cysteine desulfurase